MPQSWEVRLPEYDWIVINSSAGKDSQAMLAYVVAMCNEAAVPLSRVVVVHADLGRVEWTGTRELAEEHARHYGLRFEVVKRAQGDLLTQVKQRGKWPSSTARYCTSDHKRGQIRRLFTQLTREYKETNWRGYGCDSPCRILNCMGLRAEESPARRKKEAFCLCENASNTRRLVYDWLPIHQWSERDVWNTIKTAGTRPHHAYSLGMPRLSCCFCIFAPKSALILAGRHNPELLQEYVQIESAIGHTFRVDLTMAEVKRAVDAGEQTGSMSGQWNM